MSEKGFDVLYAEPASIYHAAMMIRMMMIMPTIPFLPSFIVSFALLEYI